MRSRGMTLGAFGGVAGVFAVFFFSDIPRFRKDVMQVCALPIKMMGGEANWSSMFLLLAGSSLRRSLLLTMYVEPFPFGILVGWVGETNIGI
jgi:hypothetical protein